MGGQPARAVADSSGSPPGGEEPRKRVVRVLLAEDEAITRLYTARMLQKLGYAVETAADGREALTLLGQGDFDLVLMDIQMPYVDGLEATRLIRAGQVPGASPSVPVVALTAYAMASDRERGLAAGMDGYVTKPFELHTLAKALQQALTR